MRHDGKGSRWLGDGRRLPNKEALTLKHDRCQAGHKKWGRGRLRYSTAASASRRHRCCLPVVDVSTGALMAGFPAHVCNVL